MTDVSFCKDGVGVERERLFMGFGIRATDHPTPRLSPYTPEVGAASSPRTAGQASAPRSTGHDTPGHWTRCTGLHSIPDKPRRVDQDGGGGLEGVRRVSETEQKRTRQNLKNKYAKKRKYLLTFTQESV